MPQAAYAPQLEQAVLSKHNSVIINAVLDTVGAVVVVLDSDGRIVQMNRAGRQLTGYTNKQVVGKCIWDLLLIPQEMERVRGVFNDLRSGRFPNTAEDHWVTRDGRRRLISWSNTALLDAAGEVEHVICAGIDITDHNRTEKALRARSAALARANKQLASANKELDSFVSVASHDLQEPVRTLVSYTTLLEEDLGDDLPDEAAADLHFISDAAQRMQTLVHDLLALSRAGRTRMKQERVSLEGCVDDALETLRLRLDEAGAEVQRGPLPEVTGDATLLTQLFQNLIGNALKFRSEQRPVIELTVEKHSHGWTLGVRDNGIGITPEHAEQVFLPFQRLHAMGEYEGSGIGLAICRKSVERHGGRIWVESEAGKGAHFMFTIPGTDDEQEKS